MTKACFSGKCQQKDKHFTSLTPPLCLWALHCLPFCSIGNRTSAASLHQLLHILLSSAAIQQPPEFCLGSFQSPPQFFSLCGTLWHLKSKNPFSNKYCKGQITKNSYFGNIWTSYRLLLFIFKSLSLYLCRKNLNLQTSPDQEAPGKWNKQIKHTTHTKYTSTEPNK